MNCFIHGSIMYGGNCNTCEMSQRVPRANNARKLYCELDSTRYDHRQEYTQKCSNCSKSVSLRTQADDDPEYYTDVFLECQKCGEAVRFYLPVN